MSITAMNSGVNRAQLAQALSELVRLCYDRGWAPATSTNYSFRVPGATGFCVSRSGVDKSRFCAADFIDVDTEGIPTEPAAPKVSAETALHAALYRRDPTLTCIVHTHSRAATVLSRQNAAAGCVILTGYELLKAFLGIATHEAHLTLPVLANSQDMVALATAADQAVAAVAACYGYLIIGHGLYTWGRSVDDAWRHLEALEFLLDCELCERLLRKEPHGNS